MIQERRPNGGRDPDLPRGLPGVVAALGQGAAQTARLQVERAQSTLELGDNRFEPGVNCRCGAPTFWKGVAKHTADPARKSTRRHSSHYSATVIASRPTT